MSQGRGWAYLGAGLGAVASVAANVAHSYVPPAGAPAQWQPRVGSIISAVFWPVALLVAVEIIARVPWPDGRRWVALRYLGLAPVAAVAATVSYRHLSGLLAWYGEDGVTSLVGPLAIDGLMLMATGALIGTARHAEPAAVPVAVPSIRLTETRPAPVVEEPAPPVALPVAAASAPRRPKVTATTRRKTSRRSAPSTRPSRVPGPCVEGCDRHDGPVGYDTRNRCAERLGALAKEPANA